MVTTIATLCTRGWQCGQCSHRFSAEGTADDAAEAAPSAPSTAGSCHRDTSSLPTGPRPPTLILTTHIFSSSPISSSLSSSSHPPSAREVDRAWAAMRTGGSQRLSAVPYPARPPTSIIIMITVIIGIIIITIIACMAMLTIR